MTEQPAEFVEGNHPGAYDFRGNFNGNVPELVPTPVVHIPAPEPQGYLEGRGRLRDEIRSKIERVKPYSSVLVPIDEWDVEVEVRSMSLGDRDEMALTMSSEDGEVDRTKFFPSVIIACTFDASGQKIFNETDVAWLRSLDAKILDKIAKVAFELNGFGEAGKGIEAEAGK